MMLVFLLCTTAACSPPPEQPDLNTYGAIQPVCLFWCEIRQTLTEGDGAMGSVTSNVTTTDTTTRAAP
jgi:hypothetical protein